MNIVLLGHDDIASKVAIRLIVRQLPAHQFKLFVSGAVGTGNAPLPEPLAALGRLDQSFYNALPWGFDGGKEDLPAPNSAEGIAELRALEPDLFISVRYRRILKRPAIEVPRYGVLNLHSGLLPQYKGVMATFWAMLNGEAEIGCTLHTIVDGTIDTGPLIGRKKIPVRTEWSYLGNVLELYPGGCRMMVDAVNRIAAGELLQTSPQTGQGHYYSMPGEQDLNRFAAQGLRLADVDDLDDFIVRHEAARDAMQSRVQ